MKSRERLVNHSASSIDPARLHFQVCVCVYIYTYIYIYIYIYIYTHTHVCMYVCMYVYYYIAEVREIFNSVFIHTRACARTHTYAHTFTHTHTHTHTNTHTHTHAHAHTFLHTRTYSAGRYTSMNTLNESQYTTKINTNAHVQQILNILYTFRDHVLRIRQTKLYYWFVDISNNWNHVHISPDKKSVHCNSLNFWGPVSSSSTIFQ